jgi:hypothetical protein
VKTGKKNPPFDSSRVTEKAEKGWLIRLDLFSATTILSQNGEQTGQCGNPVTIKPFCGTIDPTTDKYPNYSVLSRDRKTFFNPFLFFWVTK